MPEQVIRPPRVKYHEPLPDVATRLKPTGAAERDRVLAAHLEILTLVGQTPVRVSGTLW